MRRRRLRRIFAPTIATAVISAGLAVYLKQVGTLDSPWRWAGVACIVLATAAIALWRENKSETEKSTEETPHQIQMGGRNSTNVQAARDATVTFGDSLTRNVRRDQDDN